MEAVEQIASHAEEEVDLESEDLTQSSGPVDRKQLIDAEGETSVNNSEVLDNPLVQENHYVNTEEDESSTSKPYVPEGSTEYEDEAHKSVELEEKYFYPVQPSVSPDPIGNTRIRNDSNFISALSMEEPLGAVATPNTNTSRAERNERSVIQNSNKFNLVGYHAESATAASRVLPGEKREIRASNTQYRLDASQAISVQLTADTGAQLQFSGVPKKYYASEINVLIVRDTGLRHGDFKLLYKDENVAPLNPLDAMADEDGIVRLKMKITDPIDAKKIRLGDREVTFQSGLVIQVSCKKVFVTNEPSTLQDTLELQEYKDGEKTLKEVNIEWLPASHHKPFLGGYRHKITEARYHHASAQTKPLPKRKSEAVFFSRETQTYRMKHFGQATVNHMSTQFSKPGFYVSRAKDVVKIPGPYETAEEYLARKLRDIIIIQKYTRRWLAKRRVEKLKRLRNQYLEWERQHQKELADKKREQLEFDFQRRLHPKTQADFDRLFNALEQWKREEIEKINAKPLTVAERKAALALLLDEETELIAAIGRHQLCASRRQNLKGQITEMRKAAAPIRWISSINGRALEVDTPQTIRARELLDIFTSLGLEDLRDEERLDILLTTKRTVTEYQFKVCKELTKLIDRETELIIRGVPAEQLKGLRQRIINQFVKFAEIPEVNPGIANYIKVPTGTREQIAESLKGDVHYCLSCDRYLRNNAFPLSARANRLAPCLSCRRMDNRARKRIDMDPYQRMLVDLRKREVELIQLARQRKHDESKEAELVRLENGEKPQPESLIRTDDTDENVLNSNPFPFLVDKRDIQFLVDDVWERRSILSGWLDISDLVLTRWRLNEPWAPWNMILVTREEAEAHEKLGSFPLELAYADAMLNTVNQRLVMGRNAFARLRKNGIQMAYDQILRARWLQQPENSAEWLREKRQRLPPLEKHHTLLESTEERHRPVYQPPEYMLPAIKGEKRLKEVQEKQQALDGE